MKVTLKDGSPEHKGTVKVEVAKNGEFLEIFPEGYSDGGAPIALELYEGRLRLIVNPDKNDEEPQIIDLEDAKGE